MGNGRLDLGEVRFECVSPRGSDLQVAQNLEHRLEAERDERGVGVHFAGVREREGGIQPGGFPERVDRAPQRLWAASLEEVASAQVRFVGLEVRGAPTRLPAAVKKARAEREGDLVRDAVLQGRQARGRLVVARAPELLAVPRTEQASPFVSVSSYGQGPVQGWGRSSGLRSPDPASARGARSPQAAAIIESMGTRRDWIRAGLPPGTAEALSAGLPASRLWSLLQDVAEARAASRRLPALAEQWERDRFVQPAATGQRQLMEVDRHLCDATSAFESVELSPVAPLGVCSVMGRTSQNRVLSALRGTELVSDPTNVMALECARRLRRDRSTVVRLATSHRCVRAQEIPKRPGFAAQFRIFCLASAGLERRNHAFVVQAMAEHVAVMLQALDRLEAHGFTFPDRRVTLMATSERAEVAERIIDRLEPLPIAPGVLDHPYYDGGLRYQIAARAEDGAEVPLVDGGAFQWVAALTSNRRAVYVASGLGSQLVPVLFRRPD